jgi:hypothetical protein
MRSRSGRIALVITMAGLAPISTGILGKIAPSRPRRPGRVEVVRWRAVPAAEHPGRPATAASLTGHSVDVMLKHHREVIDEDRRTAAERAMLGVLHEVPRGG